MLAAFRHSVSVIVKPTASRRGANPERGEGFGWRPALAGEVGPQGVVFGLLAFEGYSEPLGGSAPVVAVERVRAGAVAPFDLPVRRGAQPRRHRARSEQ
jgi:hypothetical protein